MEFTEAGVRDFVANLVAEALQGDKPHMDVSFGQLRFVKGDPAYVVCTWPQPGGRSREFKVIFSGEAVTNFAEADQARRAKLRALAIDSIRAQHRGFDPAGQEPYPYLCQIDWLLGK